ncbi:beta/gamma crystallin-related protein [Henriciella aquimarina]|uniref:beta/gamma crystallin-related protein n=1 Tax=Henriciella aquimarina TaxID=545261 RepID=UPI000A049862|nr:beta/gamma crystallin-related protein [Henriciella aquimarina]
MNALKILSISLLLPAATALPALAQQSWHRGGGQGEAIIYVHPDFRGQSLRVTGPIRHLDRYRFNDKVSSIRITGGAWEVCVDPDYRGHCEVIQHREGELNRYRLNDNITSIRPVSYRGHDRGDRYDRRGRDDRYGRGGYPGRGDAPVVLFQHSDFQGDALPVNGAIRHLDRVHFNDKVSSIAIQGGAWEVCTDPDFRGHCEVITGSVAKTNYYRLNDNITSIRPAGRGYDRGHDRRGRW